MKMIKREIIEQVDNFLLEVISVYVDLKKSGSLYKGLSPFNSEKSPSFIVTPSKGMWKDFSSGKGGKSAIKFVMEYEGISFKDAVIKCADIVGIEVEYEDSNEQFYCENAIEHLKNFFKDNLKGNSLQYVYDRGINDASIKEWEIGFAPSYNDMVSFFNNSTYQKEYLHLKYFYKNDKGDIGPKFYNRVMFPINNKYGNTVGFSGRDITGKAKAKYVNSNEVDFFKKGKLLYGLDKVNKTSKKLIIVEGQIDVILAHQYGIRIAVASQGTGFTQFHFNLVKDYNCMIAFDGDNAGIKAMGRTVEIFLKNGVNPKVSILPEGQDIADILSSKGQKEFLKIIKHHTDGTDFIVDSVLNGISEEKRYQVLEKIKSNLSMFPNFIAEKILSKIIAITKESELKIKTKSNKYIDEMILIKYILENDLVDNFIEPFKECFNIKQINYNNVKDVQDLDEESFYDLWSEFESSCYKKRIHKIKNSNLSYKEKKEQIKELKECLNVTKFI